MPESTNQPGPNQTPIYVDKNGRRRRADGDVAKFPDNADDPSKTTAAENAALRAELAAYKAQNDARTITAPGGFSGTFGSGLSWNPFGANALGPAAGGGDTGGGGTATNPYIMGTNASDTSSGAMWDDVWDITNPPVVDGAVTDGVIWIPAPRVFQDNANTVNGMFLRPAGAADGTIIATPIYFYTRDAKFDDLGNLIYIGPEQTYLNVVATGAVPLENCSIVTLILP